MRAGAIPRNQGEVNDRESRLNTVTAAYFEAREGGGKTDPGEWLAKYPDLAPELEQLFRDDGLLTSLVSSAVVTEPGVAEWFGGFRVIRRIGRGGMAVVYEAVDPRTGQRVALKVLPTVGLLDSEARDSAWLYCLPTAAA